MKSNSYVIGVGKDDEERLALLNELFGDTSRNLLLKAGLKPGIRVLEIGCGTGNMTHWIARKIGENGHVTAVDNSGDQIKIAKTNCSDVNNISFIESSLFDLKDLAKFDVIYSRFLIMHLTTPFEAIQFLMQFLKPNGVIVCEEATNSVTACYPQSPVFQKNRELLMELLKKKGLDFDIGEKLYSYFQQLNLKDISINFVQPIYATKRQKRMMRLLMNQLKSQYIQVGLATEELMNQLLADLDQFIEDDHYLVSFARTTQIFGRSGLV